MSEYLHKNGFKYSLEEIELAAKMKNDTVENVLAANFIGDAATDPMLVDPYANESEAFLNMKQELPFASDANIRNMVYGVAPKQQSGPEDIGDVVMDKVSKLGLGVTTFVNDLYKLYETGEGGLLAEIIAEGPFQAAYGYAAAELRKRGFDVPTEYGFFQDLTSPAERRAIYEDHILKMAKDPEMTLQMAQKLDPTNRIKFEGAIDWFNKHTYSYYDGEGVAEDYLTLMAKATKSNDAKDYAKAVDSFLGDAFQALPSIMISRFNVYGVPVGAGLLGASAYMENFERELFNRGNDPGVSRNDIVLNSVITGGADMAMEIVGGGVLNRLLKGVGKETAEKLLTELPKVMAKRIGLGYLSEFTTEGLTGVLQEGADAYTFGDQKKIQDYLRTFFKDGFLGGFLGGGMVATSIPRKKQIYGYVSSNNHKQEQLQLENDIIRLKTEIQRADPAGKAVLETELAAVEAQKQKNEDNMINFFDSMTDKAKREWGKEIDLQHKQLDIIGNDKYSKKSQDNARKKLKQSTEKLSKFYKGTDLKYDAALESLLGRALKATERINKQKGFFGFNSSNLDVEYVDSESRLAEIEKNNKGFNRSDGIFVETKDGKNKIYVNMKIAGLTEATNVIGHEYLHSIVSRNFKSGIGRANLKGSISAFVKYLNDIGNAELVADIEAKIATQYDGLDADGNVIRDADGLVKTKRESDQEEYFNIFSDLIKENKVDNVVAKSAGLTNSFRALLRGFGFGSVDFQDGSKVFEFLVDYKTNMNRSSILGKITSRGIGRTKIKGLEPKVDEQGRSDVITDEGDKRSITQEEADRITEQVNDLGDMGWTNETWKESGAAFAIKVMQDEKLLDNLIAAKYKGEEVPKDFVKKVYTELTSHITNYKPDRNNESGLFGWINPQIRNKANAVYNREYKVRPDQRGPALDAKTKEGAPIVQPVAEETPSDFETENVLATQIREQRGEVIDKIAGKDRARVLKDLSDVNLNNNVEINNTIVIKVENLVKQNPKDLEQQLEKLIEKEFTKIIANDMGAISQDSKTKQVTVSEEYKAFHALGYNDIVGALSDDVIKNNYNQLFDITKVAREADKKVNPITGKVTYPGKGIYKIGTNKAKWTKYFTQGGYTTLRARRAALAKLLAKAKTKRALDNIILSNSTDVNKKIDAKLREFANSLDNQSNQIKSFDTVKYSSSAALENNLNFIEIIMQKTTELARVKKADGTPLFADNGRALEQAINDFIKELNIPGLKSMVEAAGEKDNMADLQLGLFIGDKKIAEFGVEIKLGTTNVRLTSNRISNYDINTGAVTFTEKNPYASETKEVINREKLFKKGEKAIQAYYKEVNDLIERYNNGETIAVDEGTKKKPNIVRYKRGKNPKVPLVKSSNDIMPRFAHKLALSKGLGVAVQKATLNDSVDLGDLVEVSYADKKHPSEYIEFLGNFFALGSDKYFNGDVPVLAGLAKINIEMGSSGTLKATKKGPMSINYGIRMVKVAPRIMPSPGKITSKAKGSLADGNYVRSLMEKHYKQPKYSKNQIDNQTLVKAIKASRSTKNVARGITILDFDDTLATSKSLVRYTRPDGTEGTLTPEQYASNYESMLDKGIVFDFSEFNKVIDGKIAPLFQKALKLQNKFGPKNMFVLTARPPQAQKAIFDFLKANGLNIPIDNITGLGNSTSEAKALWIAGKVGEGFNDFYFADDALQNVQAVKNMLDQFDVKSKVQQARVKFSNSLDTEFNQVLEEVTGIDAAKRFSAMKARKRGANKGKFRFFIPPSHEDFVGLLYNFMGRGKQGDAHRDFFERALIKPLNRGYREIDAAKQAIANDYKSLNKEFADVKKMFTKKTPDGDYTVEDAIRVYLWDKHGHPIPGMSTTDQANLVEFVKENPNLRSYAENLNVISKQEKYVPPQEGWDGGNIRIDLIDATGRTGRAEYFVEFQENADIIFSEENLNKIEAGYGVNVREALEDMLHRIKTGVNRPKGQSGTVNKFMNYLNGSVGSVMFFNTRSALLQQMSIVNYINFADNNIFAAATAFANQPQYWKDFAFIFNSDMLKQRRGGIQTDINGAELAQTVAKSTNPMQSVISKLLQLGFLPTQIGDNIAIATGGATFYRNRINKYIKDGLSKKEAEQKAFTDFQDITQSTQQSARPDMTSKQQASWVGKLILNFQNVTSQYNRLMKKAAADIIKGRITPPNTSKLQSNLSNASRILYYGAVQNIVFYSLQTALFALMFDDEKEENEQLLKKRERVINGTIDSILRGAGIYGAAVSTLKNMAIAFAEERGKSFNFDESSVIMEGLNFSPVVGIKARKFVNAEKTLNYNKKVIPEMETFDLDNPVWSAVTNLIEASTNAPTNRLYNKTINVRDAMDTQFSTFQRIMMFSGYSKWNQGIDDPKMEAIRESVKKKSKNKKKKSESITFPTL
jgi:hypothetical protein